MTVHEEAIQGPVQALVDRGEQRGCLELSELSSFIEETGLAEVDVDVPEAISLRRFAWGGRLAGYPPVLKQYSAVGPGSARRAP